LAVLVLLCDLFHTLARPLQKRPRYAPELIFPEIAYVPGETPHPGRHDEETSSWPPKGGPMKGGGLNLALGHGVDLFNHGYFWEAHEAWEEPWQVERRDSPHRLYLQGLIRLAAAALKFRTQQPAGVMAHAGWCAEVFDRLYKQHPGIADVGGGPEPLELAALAGRLSQDSEAWDVTWNGPNPCLETVLVMSRFGPSIL
jgi:hypothetical protein